MPRARSQYVSEMRERFLDPSRSVSRARGSYDLRGVSTAGDKDKEDKTTCTDSSAVDSSSSDSPDVAAATSSKKQATIKIEEEEKEKEEEEEEEQKIRAHIDPEVNWIPHFKKYIFFTTL